MSMETDFRALLAGNVAIIAVVGSNAGPVPAAGPSIYPNNYARGAASPVVRYAKVTGAPGLHMQGSDGLSTDLMQVDVRSVSAAETLAVRDALVALLHGYHGTQGGTDFRLIALRDDRGLEFEKTDAETFQTTSLDFDISSRAAA